MKQVTAREANQRFSKLLADVAAGKEVVITRHGKPVARLVPMSGSRQSAQRAAAVKRMVAMMKKGIPLGGRKFDRDEMYER
ncbi:MAG: type II toxin-antitoxin system Phd/YefM family antitoxin [Dongiaceae bacterium]